MSGISSEFLQEKLQKEFNPIHLVGLVYILSSVYAIYAHKFGFADLVFKDVDACGMRVHVVSVLPGSATH